MVIVYLVKGQDLLARLLSLDAHSREVLVPLRRYGSPVSRNLRQGSLLNTGSLGGDFPHLIFFYVYYRGGKLFLYGLLDESLLCQSHLGSHFHLLAHLHVRVVVLSTLANGPGADLIIFP